MRRWQTIFACRWISRDTKQIFLWQKKRLLIRSALLNYSRMGTKAALEDAVGIIHGGTSVQENWEYGGQPYFFRVAVDAGQEKVAENPVGRLLDTIMEYKMHVLAAGNYRRCH